MKFGAPLSVLLQLMFVFAAEAGNKCTLNEDTCNLQLGSEANSLSKYKNQLINFVAGDDDEDRRYWFVPCGVPRLTSVCSGYKGCQTEKDYGSSYPLGDPEKSTCSYDSEKVVIKYGAVDYDDTKRGIIATYECDQTTDGLTLTVGKPSTDSSGANFFPMTLKGTDACFKASFPSSGMSGAAIFLIIYFVVIGLYLAVGLIYKGGYKGARGTEMIPNVQFWLQVPGLIRDGSLFIYRSTTEKCCNKGYNSV